MTKHTLSKKQKQRLINRLNSDDLVKLQNIAYDIELKIVAFFLPDHLSKQKPGQVEFLENSLDDLSIAIDNFLEWIEND